MLDKACLSLSLQQAGRQAVIARMAPGVLDEARHNDAPLEFGDEEEEEELDEDGKGLVRWLSGGDVEGQTDMDVCLVVGDRAKNSRVFPNSPIFVICFGFVREFGSAHDDDDDDHGFLASLV